MRHIDPNRLSYAALASLLLYGVAQAAPPATAASADSAPRLVTLGASHCISLGVRQRGALVTSMVATPALSNRCDYPVVVSYCIADGGRDPHACGAVGEKPAATRRLEAHETVTLDDRGTVALDNEINWAACRALPGVASGLGDGGSSGYCRAPSSLLARQTP
ncbi:hypothetical protein [Solimonas soli]|uniref:hypothetical protein n=1 Tax=Solimonas soli TaxID=413479 RepID=UPI000481C6AD|nr:hypothetical protein [Solimonas soli]